MSRGQWRSPNVLLTARYRTMFIMASLLSGLLHIYSSTKQLFLCSSLVIYHCNQKTVCNPYNTDIILLQNKPLGVLHVCCKKLNFQKCIAMLGFCRLDYIFPILPVSAADQVILDHDTYQCIIMSVQYYIIENDVMLLLALYSFLF